MPTPRPIIEPRIVANSGTDMTLLMSAMNAEPMPMPNRATPMGRPMASTEPNATIRMTMANARPSASDEGVSNSAKSWPPASIRRPSISGALSLMMSRTALAWENSASLGNSTVA